MRCKTGVIKDFQTIFLNFLHKENWQIVKRSYSIYKTAGIFTGQLFQEKLEQGSTEAGALFLLGRDGRILDFCWIPGLRIAIILFLWAFFSFRMIENFSIFGHISCEFNF